MTSWVPQILAVGSAKLALTPMMVDIFEQIGIGQIGAGEAQWMRTGSGILSDFSSPDQC